MTRKLPFDIIPEQYHLIPVSQQAYSAMVAKSASPLEKKAAKLIEDKWCEGDDENAEFGVEIPLRYGWTGVELPKISAVKAREKYAAIAGLELIGEVATGLGISVDESQALVSQVSAGGSIPVELTQFAAQILEFFEKQSSIDEDMLRETVLMQRAIPSWTQELTLALHQEIRDSLLELVIKEEQAGIEPDPKPQTDSAPLPSLETPSSESEPAEILIGAA